MVMIGKNVIRCIEESSGFMKKDGVRYLRALVIFIILSAILTYPLAFTSTSKLPGSEDIYQAVWYFWETGQAVHKFINDGSLSSLEFTDTIFYPTGTPIIPFSMAYNQILAILLVPLIGAVLTLNFLYFSSFVLSGFGAYLLVRHITNDEPASIISGIIYTFAPYHFEHAFVGHIGSVTMQWIPFCALFLLKMAETKKPVDAVLAAVFFILVAASDMQYMVFMGTFIMLFFSYQFISGGLKIQKRDILTILVFLAVSLVILIPLNASSITTALSGDNFLKPGQSEAAGGSVDIFNFILPSVHHPVFGSWIQENYFDKINATRITWERVAFIGYTVLFLIVFESIRERSKALLFWQISAIFFALMSLGPILHIFGQTIFFGYEIPMPFKILSHIIPGLDNSRTPGRFEVLTLLSITVIAGQAITRIRKDIRSLHIDTKSVQKLQTVIPLVIMTLIIFEYLSIPFVTSDPSMPEFYCSLAKEPGDFAILEIPATYNYSSGIMAEYYQTIHNKKLVGGQLSRIPDSSRAFEKSMPFIHEITYPESPDDIFKQNISAIASPILNKYNIRYIVLHKNFMENDVFQKTNNFTSEGLGPTIYSDEQIVVYKVDRSSNAQFIEIGQNWNDRETWSGTPTRWMEDNATIKIYSPEDKTAILSFSVLSFNNSRQLMVVTNDNPIYNKVISPEFIQVNITVNLTKGDNVIRYIAINGPVQVSDVLHNGDNRQISFAFQNISIE